MLQGEFAHGTLLQGESRCSNVVIGGTLVGAGTNGLSDTQRETLATQIAQYGLMPRSKVKVTDTGGIQVTQQWDLLRACHARGTDPDGLPAYMHTQLHAYLPWQLQIELDDLTKTGAAYLLDALALKRVFVPASSRSAVLAGPALPYGLTSTTPSRTQSSSTIMAY